MRHGSRMITIQRTSAFRLDPTLNAEETIILRALASGNTDRQVCNELHMNPDTYLRVMREVRQKIHMADNVSLIEWAKERIKSVDQRINQANGQARLA
jgi:DNA-binding NarL/FixJ family response regulator